MSKDEIMDEELTGMISHTDETMPAQMSRMEPRYKAEPKREVPAPYPNARRSTIARLKSMAKWLGICGGICMLLWWFEVNGLMAFEAAYPCIFFSGCIGCIGVGRSSVK